jgi:dynein heavy chain
LDPEEVEKDHKTMLLSANKLGIRFNNSKLPKPEKIANDLKSELLKFRDYLPVIRALCNPGLKSRHWDKITGII